MTTRSAYIYRTSFSTVSTTMYRSSFILCPYIHILVVDARYTMRFRCCQYIGSGGMYASYGTTSLDGDITFTSNSAGNRGGKLVGFMKLDFSYGCTFWFTRVHASDKWQERFFARHVRDSTRGKLPNNRLSTP